jgi:hypothetical protein
MPRCQADKSIQRVQVGDFQFPLGVYPVEKMAPKPGYTVTFEPADGGGGEGGPDGAGSFRPDKDAEKDDPSEGGEGPSGPDDWEEWPDRYVFDAVVSAHRVESLCRALFSLLPGRVYPILDVLGRDAFREVDPYITYELVGTDRFLNACRWLRDFFYEDGLVGFGAMSEEPFFYIFIDEHKIVTVRAEPVLKDKIEKVLAAFDLSAMSDPAGADSASHEHRGVLLAPGDRPELLDGEQILEFLKDDWKLVLNIDHETNIDDEQNALGTTGWRCLLRGENEKETRYAIVCLAADHLKQAEETAFDTLAEMCDKAEIDFDDAVVISADRIKAEEIPTVVEGMTKARIKPVKVLQPGKVFGFAWVGEREAR